MHSTDPRSRPFVSLARSACVAGLALSPLAASPNNSPLGASATAPASGAQVVPNVIVIVLDDLGTDKLRMYHSPTEPGFNDLPHTPVLAGLAANGILFDRCRANPTCSPTRAALMTGKYGFRTGMLNYISGGNTEFTLPDTNQFLPEKLKAVNTRFQRGAFGKWHLAENTPANYAHPFNNGFQKFVGHMGNNDGGGQSHKNWTKVTADSSGASATTETEWDARVVRQAAEQWLTTVNFNFPFFAYVAFNPPHAPFQIPGLYPSASAPTNIDASTFADADFQYVLLNDPDQTIVPPLPCGNTGHADLARSRIVYRANVEAVDYEIGLLLASLPAAELAETVVFVIGDNGTPDAVMDTSGTAPSVNFHAPYPPNHGKKFNNELGTRVPLIVQGQNVVTGPCNALVDAVDVWNTIVELAAGAPDTSLDSQSFKARLLNASAPTTRTFSYAEAASYNGLAYSPTTALNTGWISIPSGTELVLPGNFTFNRSLVHDNTALMQRFKYMRNGRCVNIAPCGTPACDPNPCALPLPLRDYCSLPRPAEELYNLSLDPNELCNVVCDPAYAAELSAMRAHMDSLSGG